MRSRVAPENRGLAIWLVPGWVVMLVIWAGLQHLGSHRPWTGEIITGVIFSTAVSVMLYRWFRH